jgi:hypothetical protein
MQLRAEGFFFFFILISCKIEGGRLERGFQASGAWKAALGTGQTTVYW